METTKYKIGDEVKNILTGEVSKVNGIKVEYLYAEILGVKAMHRVVKYVLDDEFGLTPEQLLEDATVKKKIYSRKSSRPVIRRLVNGRFYLSNIEKD